MEKITYAGDNQRKIERFLLIIFTIYNLFLISEGAKQQWNNWVVYLMVAALSISWIMHIGKYKDYEFRAKLSAIMMQGSMVLYGIHTEEFADILPVFLAFVVFMGLYGVAKIIGLSAVSILIIFVCHAVVIKSIPLSGAGEIISALLRMGNIFLLEFVVYMWTKRNAEGSRQLLGAIEELKNVEHRKDDFLANVSHEIRTPINTICGMSELVLREELPYRVMESVLNIQMAGRNLMAIVRDILDFSELQSGKMELEEEAYNITSTINDVINMTMARKDKKNIELIVDCDPNIPCGLFGDEKKLRRVMMSLLDNAVKFTEEGCVTMLVGYRKESYGINLVITIKDTGIGMEEESLEKLFTNYNQVDAGRKRREGGIGLGLAISRALVQKMGGTITVQSKLGKGSRVQFVVPQKVLDEAPIAFIHNRKGVNVATYINMEQFDKIAIRDDYTNMIIHMVENLKGKCHICRNLSELQRRTEMESFSHIFISVPEYREAPAFFDRLAQLTRVVVVLERLDEKYVTNPMLLKVYKPFYILSIVSVLNGTYDKNCDGTSKTCEKFETINTHVLVVDDNRMNIRVIEGLLTNYKIKVSIATSGHGALEKIVSANYDFVFMDHMMPEMDGVETLQRIRHKVGTYFQKVPIIALTANAVAGTRETLLKEGFNDFVEKPIERSVLERVLKRNLPPEKIVYKDNKVPVPAGIEKEEGEQPFEMEGLDVAKGILYCNGKEAFIKVLQGYCEDFNDSGKEADELFEKEDWKNYTIVVHGLKSAMRSIGALPLSNLAKELEFAGKEGRVEYIKEHHAELMREYRKLFAGLRKNPMLCPNAEEKKDERVDADAVETEEAVVCELPVLKKEAFQQLIAKMEEAMYALDGEILLEILSKLQEYQYHGTSLKEALSQARRKVEMSDYISAVETVVKLKSKLEKEK